MTVGWFYGYQIPPLFARFALCLILFKRQCCLPWCLLLIQNLEKLSGMTMTFRFIWFCDGSDTPYNLFKWICA